MKSIKAIFRRGGQNSKGDHHHQHNLQGCSNSGGSGGDLSRTSSISNINVAEQKSKGALSKTATNKKPTSREKLDKINQSNDKDKKSNDKKRMLKINTIN